MTTRRVGVYMRLYAAYIPRIALPRVPGLGQYNMDCIYANTYWQIRVGRYKRIYAAYMRENALHCRNTDLCQYAVHHRC